MNHHRKWIRRLMRWMWCVLVLTVCQQALCIEQPFRLVAENTTCLDIASRLACTGNDQFYHCLLDENYTKEFEVCRDWKWIPGGKCAYFNSYGRGNVDERNCEGNLTLKCAPGQFRSYMNTQYKACYVKKRIPATTPISTVTIRPTSSGGSVPPNITGGVPPGSVPPESQFDGSALAIAFGVIVPLILLVVVGIQLFKRRRHPGGTSKEEPTVESGEGDTLLSSGTKCQEENEQNDRQQKRTSKEESPVESGEGDTLPSTQENEQNDKHEDERTSKEAKESSPLLAGNTNQNQKESVENRATNEVNKLDSSQKNDSFLTPPTSPSTAPATAQDIVTKHVDDKGEEKKDKEEEPKGRQNSEEGVSPEEKKEEESKGTFPSTDEVSDSDTKNNLQLLAVDDKEKENMVENSEENQNDREGNGDKDQTLHASSCSDKPSDQSDKADSNDEKKKIQIHVDGSSGENSEKDNGGGSSDNVSMKHVDEQKHEHQNKTTDSNLNNSADPGSNQDGNEEDTSKETERNEAVGIFVDSLESIQKEDDEESGTNELHGLLDHMCTGAARKILFNVVKEYVDNPESYFHDESKKASLKTELPPEYHSALNPESEDRKSIPISYFILQLSLSAGHQPKSGWGQKVKDTDTGVGDDVERVHKVHMLMKEIQNPEEISVDGYVRLFEMLIGAVERLDIKGKCSEDYKKIVGEWENIQRKQWVKDKWNTFTNFIKKWSE